MKKYFYLGFILVFFSLTAQAMEQTEEEKQNALALQALQKIVETAFPLALYEPHKDGDVSDQGKLLRAGQAIQEDSMILNFPVEILSHCIFPYLDSKALLLGVGRTCRSFYELSTLSFFYLNPYCLTETMPHDIPIHILRFKTLNTKNGIFKIAELSVSAEHLKNWFEPDFLKAAYSPCQNSLPTQLEGQSEEDLGKLYPILKVALASGLVNTADAQDPVMKLLREYPYPYGLSLNKMRLISLSPTRPGVYYETLGQLINSQYAYSGDSAQVRDVLARELLMAGKNVVNINNSFFVYPYDSSHPKRGVGIQILDWCVHNPQFYQGHDNSQLIHSALFVERSDLALKVLRKVVEFPNDADSLPPKIQSFLHYKDREIEDPQIQSRVRQFSTNLYSFWGQLPTYEKFPALSLLMQAERREEVSMAMDDILLLPEQEVLNSYYLHLLFGDASKYNYPEELEKFTRYLFNVETGKLITLLSQCNKDDVFTQLIKMDREKSIALLKALVESDQVHVQSSALQDKIDTLSVLAQHAIEEKDYVISQVHSLNYEEKDKDDVESNLCAIYYFLNEPELCHLYYQKSIHQMLNETDHKSIESHAKMLKKLQEEGLDVKCIEDLLDCDPFKVFSILEAKKD